jgi:HSP20 family molecular chaperone IbpA
MTAKYENGLLTVHVPKDTETKTRAIEVKVR